MPSWSLARKHVDELSGDEIGIYGLRGDKRRSTFQKNVRFTSHSQLWNVDKQIDSQSHSQPDTQTHRQINIHVVVLDRRIYLQTDRQTKRTDIERDMETYIDILDMHTYMHA